MFKKIGIFLGRFFVSVPFLIAAIHKMGDWQSTETELVHALTRWNGHAAELPAWLDIFQDALHIAPFLLIIATIFELLGSISLLFGFKAKLGTFLLVCFVIPVTLVFHPFWFFEGNERNLQEVMFLKNLAILGGLFLYLAYGKKESSNPHMDNPDLGDDS